MAQRSSFLVGLIGSGIQQSRTPAMHEREGARRGLAYVYRLIDLDRTGQGAGDLGEILDYAERLGFDGLNVTHPCKQAVLPHLHELDDDARDIGAVNTVVLRDGRRKGYNTDAWGFTQGLLRGLGETPRGTVLQLGAGGAGSATAQALLKLGVSKLMIYDTDADRAAGLARRLDARFPGRVDAVDDPVAAARAAEGLVQATPIGMAAHPGMSIAPEALRPDLWVAEIIYFPLETELLRCARALGCRTVDGSGMAVFQAVGAFQLFTGISPDADAMARDLFDRLPDEQAGTGSLEGSGA